MCGLVGMAGDVRPDHRKAFADMLLVCQVRGRDSTGAFRVGHHGATEVAKMVGTPEILLGSRTYDNRIDTFGKAYVGHCRSKTFGDVSYANAHPFKHEHITGVHNGTLRGIYGRDKANDFGTDSEWLYYTAAQEGMEDTIKSLDNDGAWALVWWDEREKTLNFLRNDKRPLWFTFTKDLKIMLWASEIWMFGAFHRHFELWDGGEEKKVYYSLPVDQLYSYKIDAHGKTPKDVFTITSIKEVKGAEVRGYRGNGGVGGGTNGGSVNSPFQSDGTAEARNLVMRMMGYDPADNLDDPLDDVLPGHRHLPRLPAPISGQGDATTTTASAGTSSKNSSNVLDFRMGKTNSPSGKRPTLSVPQQNSQTSVPEASGVPFDVSKNCTKDSGKPVRRTDFRTVAGVPYISCKTSSREWSEEEFDQITEGKCSYCKNPIGDLEEVHQIFVTKVANSKEEHVHFICTSCVTPKGM